MNTQNQNAQVVLEYVTLIGLMIAAIIVMGPYTIRSINSYFKFSEEQIQDSAADEIKAVPSSNLPIPGCSCDGWVPGGCGTTIGGNCMSNCDAPSCSPFQRYYRRHCNMDSCGVSKCENVGDCVAETQGECGGWNDSTKKNCEWDERSIKKENGVLSWYECINEHNCTMACKPKTAHSTWCEGQTVYGTPDAIDTEIVATLAQCLPATLTKCRAHCDEGYFLHNNSCLGCIPPEQSVNQHVLTEKILHDHNWTGNYYPLNTKPLRPGENVFFINWEDFGGAGTHCSEWPEVVGELTDPSWGYQFFNEVDPAKTYTITGDEIDSIEQVQGEYLKISVHDDANSSAFHTVDIKDADDNLVFHFYGAVDAKLQILFLPKCPDASGTIPPVCVCPLGYKNYPGCPLDCAGECVPTTNGCDCN
ncbi:MAG: hypothetical protein WC750_06130 [Patescibacteria group bacterium]|jgi:hypothetical protein